MPGEVAMKKNKKQIIVLSFVAAAFAGGFIYGRWYRGAATEPIVDAHSNRKILSYTCSMHPSYKSEKPGKCPMCDMDLEPVRTDDGQRSGSEGAAMIHISPEKQQLIGVEYGTVDYGPVSGTTRVAARVEADESKIYHVQSKLDGWVDRVYVTVVGTLVRKNQPLLTIFNPMSIEAQAALIKHAKGGIRAGGSTVPNNPKRADPQADNPGNGPAVPQAITTSTEAADPLFESDIMRLESMGFDDGLIMNIARTGIPVYNLTIASPADGFVVERNALPKQKMSPDTLYTIADLSTVYVTADIPEYLGSVVRVGQPAALMLPGLSGKKIKGTIESILPVADPVSHTLKLRMVVANPDYALKLGMYGDLEIQSGSLKRLTVPREAILDSGLKRIVFVDRGDGNLESKEVSTGQNFGNRVEVLGGLKAGDRIVTSGNFLIDSESQLKASRGSRNQ